MKCTLPVMVNNGCGEWFLVDEDEEYQLRPQDVFALSQDLAERIIKFIQTSLEVQENMVLGVIDEQEARTLLEEMTK